MKSQVFANVCEKEVMRSWNINPLNCFLVGGAL